jgi:hypothetical protein
MFGNPAAVGGPSGSATGPPADDTHATAAPAEELASSAIVATYSVRDLALEETAAATRDATRSR